MIRIDLSDIVAQRASDNNSFRVPLTKYYCLWRVNGIIDSRVRLRCCGIMGTMMELCGLTQSTFEVKKKFTSLHARARINAGYMIARVSMVATIFPHGNWIMYYGYVKFDENPRWPRCREIQSV